MGGYDPCLDDYAKAFYNKPDVQKALHASDGHNLRNWSICKYILSYFSLFCTNIYINLINLIFYEFDYP